MDLKTKCARSNQHRQPEARPLAPVIVPSSTFGFENLAEVERYYRTGEGYVYSRYGNPTVDQTERLLADLEGAEEAVCFASGMAAITTAVSSGVVSGDRVMAQRELYGGTVEYLSEILPRSGVEVDWISIDELHELDRLEPGRLEGCRLLYLESPANPSLRQVDLERVAEVARRAKVTSMIDATFATPVYLRPLELGIDLVIHSATKYLGGHGDLTGGAVAGRAEVAGPIRQRRRLMGGTMDPFSAFLLHRGMRTLVVRMEAHTRGAEAVTRFLESCPAVDRVFYPGFGGMVSFVVRGGAEGARKAHDRLKLFVKAGSLGSIESLVSIPATMSHRHLDAEAREACGVEDGLVRLSVGLEAPEDLVADLRYALASA